MSLDLMSRAGAARSGELQNRAVKSSAVVAVPISGARYALHRVRDTRYHWFSQTSARS